MKEISRFIRWSRKRRFGNGLICHFYIEKSRNQFYSTVDYAWFNLLKGSGIGWIVKGTPKHGISSQRKKRSPVPCLNCFQINDTFYEALQKLSITRIDKFEFGIIFNKRKIRNNFGKSKVIDVSIEPPSPLPPPNKCHYYDKPRKRKGVLFPFNFCNVVRIETRRRRLRKTPIVVILRDTIMGFLVKEEDYEPVLELLEAKEWDDIEIFNLL